MPECRVRPLHPTIQILCPCFEPEQSLSTLFRRARALQLTLELQDDLESAHSIANSHQLRTRLFHKQLAIVQLHFAILGCCPATNRIRASRGQKNIESIKKVASKRARRDGALHVTISGSDHSHIGAKRLSSTDTLLQNTQESDLGFHWQFTNLIEKERASFRKLEATEPPLNRPGKRLPFRDRTVQM